MFSEAIAAARTLLPWWVPWANLLIGVPMAALAAALATWAAAAVATRPLRAALAAGPVEWHERARLEYPFRRSIWRVRLTAMLMLSTVMLLLGDDLAYVSSGVVVALAAIAAFFASGSVSRRYRPREKIAKATRKQAVKVLAFLAIWFCRLPLALAMLFLIGPDLGTRTWITLAVGVALFASLWFGGATWLLRIARVIVPPCERLLAAVRVAAGRCKTPAPSTFLLELPLANAFALPPSRTVVMTRKAVDLFDDAELAAICTHEVAHLTEGPWMAIGRHVGDGALLLLVFGRVLVERIGPFATLLIVAGTVVVVAVVAKLVASHGEHRADAIAHASEADPAIYLRALERLHKENGLPLALSKHRSHRRGFLRVLFGRGGTHGSFVDRATALGVEAPADLKPPSRARSFAAVMSASAVLAVAVTALIALEFAASMWIAGAPATGRNLRMALGHDARRELLQLADEYQREGRVADAFKLRDAAIELEGRDAGD